MSLKVLLRCSDDEFERLISMMDMESVMDIISEMQEEMDCEQTLFDDLSFRLAKISDQASPDFMRISNELMKSQNKLSLLMSRNMHCFNVNNELADMNEEADIITYKTEDDPSKVLNKERKVIINDENSNFSKSSTFPSPASSSPRIATKKVVKVTKVVTKRLVRSSKNGDTPIKRTETIPIRQSNNTPVIKVSQPDTSEVKTVSSAIANLTISSSPGLTPRDVKPKRTLRVRSGSNASNASNSDTNETAPAASTPRTLDVSASTTEKKTDLSSSESSSGFQTARSQQSPSVREVSPQIAVTSVLELDMPETSIDEEWPDNSNLCTPRGGDLDKASCTTTDESGFTSASSDTDVQAIPPDVVFDYHSEEDEKVQERTFMKSWDPVKLLQELYALRLAREPSMNDIEIINMEGYLERLPVGKNKNTLLKTWRRTYCRSTDGIIYFYDNKKSETAQSFMSLMGGKVEELSNRMLGIDDMRGHFLMVRCPSDSDFMNWRRSFYTQIKCSPHTNYIRPALVSKPGPTTPKVVVIDLGSTSVRAGTLGATSSYPKLFFPCVSSLDADGKMVFGHEAYKPDNRVNGFHHPIASTKRIETYRINIHALPDLFKKIFNELKVNPSENLVMLSTPHNFSTRLKEETINVLIGKFGVVGVNMVNQSLLTPYIYNATSGIVVDIGERIEIVAITDGYLVENGLNRQAYGGGRITETLNSYLVQYRLFTAVEHLIVRTIKEKACFVSQDYGEDLLCYMTDSSGCEAIIDLNKFQLPEGSHMKQITVDTARFKAPEGLIKTELMGIDSSTLPKLIEQAIQRCPMDVRREMWQSVYLSGGTTLIPGFPERLQSELSKLAPSSITVQVHASPHRYHAAYIGATMLAKLPNFVETCITREEWETSGNSALNKWKHYFQG